MRSLMEIGNEMTPTGKMRAAINLGNPILATRDLAWLWALEAPTTFISRVKSRRLRSCALPPPRQLPTLLSVKSWKSPQASGSSWRQTPGACRGCAEGRFMVINQAMGTPRGRDAAVGYLTEFIEEMKSSGFVAQSLKRHGIVGASVAPLSTGDDAAHG